jgi:hypothetical protein
VAKRLPIKFVMSAAMSLLGLPVAAAPPPAAPDGAAGLRVNLAIDTSLLDSAVAARLEPEIARQLGPVLEQADLHVVSPPEVGEQTLSVRVTAFDEEQRNYEIDLLLGDEGGVSTLATVTCDACNEMRLIAELVEEIPRLVELHEENHAKDGNAIPLDKPGVDRPVPEVSNRVADSPEREFTRMSALGGVGIGAVVLGVGGLLAGGIELERGKVYDDPMRTPPVWTGTYHQPLGRAVLGVGAVVLAGGVTMLAVDLIRMKKRRDGRRAGRVYPLWDAHSVGLGYSLRL